MRIALIVAAVVASLFGPLAAQSAQAGIVITVDKSAQELTVNVDGATRYRWPVSTARWGYNTPNGTYRPQRLERQWFSRKYDMSPMPYSIFFAGGYAIHGSNEISRLGRPASHGCIRLHPSNAAVLFDLVKRNTAAVRIDITGSRPDAMVEKHAPRRAVTRQVEFRPRQRVVRDDYVLRSPRRSHQTFEEVFYGAPGSHSRRSAQWSDY